MISQTAEYALRAMVVLLGEETPPGSYLAAQDIAARTKVPVDYMAKILNALVKARLVVAQRGRNGGCKAARLASEISVLDIVQAVDPIRRIETCPLGLASHGIRLCPLHRRLDDAIRTVEEAFRSTTFAELLNEPTESKPLCESARIYHVQSAAH
jgi:Rrf2 family nitric oxide-sensitive transcriptional repressor